MPVPWPQVAVDGHVGVYGALYRGSVDRVVDGGGDEANGGDDGQEDRQDEVENSAADKVDELSLRINTTVVHGGYEVKVSCW